MLREPGRIAELAATSARRTPEDPGNMSESESVYQVHPFLDPRLSETRPAILRFLYKEYLLMGRSHEQYNAFLNTLLNPLAETRSLEANLATAGYYMSEAMHYVRGLLELVPEEARHGIAPNSKVSRCSDVFELMSMIFGAEDPIVAWEAQRKLFLTKLFFDIDHSWEVQRGGEHKDYLETVLRRELFSQVSATRRVDVCYSISPDGETIDYSVGRLKAGQECWSFDLQEVEMLLDGRPVRLHIYLYSCRFKREVTAYEYRRGADHYEMTPDHFAGLAKRRSASIASKMIRKGESDPRWTNDLIGVMFIVDNMSEVETLKEFVFGLFGGFFRVRNIIDTLGGGRDRAFLNPHSGPGYKVYKAELDVLYNTEKHPAPLPYYFTVEVQIYTLESYLRTIHSSHYANHRRLKQRQFLEGIVPYMWPPSVYGEEAVETAVRSSEANGALLRPLESMAQAQARLQLDGVPPMRGDGAAGADGPPDRSTPGSSIKPGGAPVEKSRPGVDP